MNTTPTTHRIGDVVRPRTGRNTWLRGTVEAVRPCGDLVIRWKYEPGTETLHPWNVRLIEAAPPAPAAPSGPCRAEQRIDRWIDTTDPRFA